MSVVTKVKICGITSIADAAAAAKAGADAIGLVMTDSSRRVSQDIAGKIAESLPPFITPVLVFSHEEADEILEASRRTGVATVQISFTPSRRKIEALCKEGLKVIQRIGISPEGIINEREILTASTAAALLLDTVTEGKEGGTGKTFPLSAISNVSFPLPVILAGGLTPENVGKRVRKIRPWGVDVASGVERSPGIKDENLLKDFIYNAKSAAWK